MRGPVVRSNLIRIQLAHAAEGVLGPDRIFHIGRLAIAPAGIDVGRVTQKLRLGPVHEVLRRRRADIPAVAKVAMILAVLPALGIPEREVVRVKGALRDDGLPAEQRPVEAVGRLERVQPVLAASHAERLVSGVGSAVGIRVAERHKRVGPHAIPDDVVLLRVVPGEESQLGLRPVDSVRTFGVTVQIARVRSVLAFEIGIVTAAIVHPILLAVLKHRDIVGPVPFPRFVGRQGNVLRRWLMQSQIGLAPESFDKRIIDEQLTPRVDNDRLRSQGDRVDQQQRQQDQRAHHELPPAKHAVSMFSLLVWWIDPLHDDLH